MRLIDEHTLEIKGIVTVVDEEVYIKLADVEKSINEAPTIHPQGIDKDRLIEELVKYEYSLTDNTTIILDDKAYRGMRNALVAVRNIINQQPTTDGWIPCSVAVPANAVPDECDDILIKRVTGEIIRGWYWSGSGRWWTKENGIGHEVRNAIAWMPYKESE